MKSKHFNELDLSSCYSRRSSPPKPKENDKKKRIILKSALVNNDVTVVKIVLWELEFPVILRTPGQFSLYIDDKNHQKGHQNNMGPVHGEVNGLLLNL